MLSVYVLSCIGDAGIFLSSTGYAFGIFSVVLAMLSVFCFSCTDDAVGIFSVVLAMLSIFSLLFCRCCQYFLSCTGDAVGIFYQLY